MRNIVLIAGPTAVGKTALSIQLAKHLNAEVISGDSMQVYRHLDIGTAKVTTKEMAGITHHLINIRDVDQRFSVADFKQIAGEAITEIDNRGRLPLVVGGTGFYLQALVENLSLGNDHFDEESADIRQHWHAIANEKGAAYVHTQLAKKDPKAAANIPQENLRRTIRALEVIEKTGRKFSDQPTQAPKYRFYTVGLNTARPVLYQRINQRVDQMMTAGLLDEAKWLFDQGGLNYQAGKGIGYRELFPYFMGECSLDEAVEKIKQDSRHYAKRQLTWFRHHLNTHWYDLVSGIDNVEEIEDDVVNWLKSVENGRAQVLHPKN